MAFLKNRKNILKKMAIAKFRLDAFGKEGVGGGLFALPSFSSPKERT